MAYQIGWVALKTDSPDEILSFYKLKRTNNQSSDPDCLLSITQLKNGWCLLHVNDFLSPVLSDSLLAKLSKRGDVVSCQVHEGIMVSSISCFKLGQKTFGALHNSELGLEHLEEYGEPSTNYSDIKTDTEKNQKELVNIDLYFDLPVHFADELVGFRHERNLDEGEFFTEVILETKTQRKSNIQNPRPEQKIGQSFGLQAIYDATKLVGYFEGLLVTVSTLLLCFVVFAALSYFSAPNFIIPLVLAPLTFFTPLLILKKGFDFKRQPALINAGLTSAFLIAFYLFKTLT
jgi:hypothetical protein